MFVSLSHPLSETDPGWPGAPGFSLEENSSIAAGDDSNTYILKLFNHFGTHIDAPGHFVAGARRIADFSIEDLVFSSPLLLDIPKGLGEYVSAADLTPYAEAIGKADLLIIRSGMKDLRLKDPEGFARNGPALMSEAARYLMDNFSNLKAIGSDWISIASPALMPDGVHTHHYLLGKHHDRHLFIIEDMKLDAVDHQSLKRVIVAPLFIKGVDSAPATVLAEID